jgi:hypothetical protein
MRHVRAVVRITASAIALAVLCWLSPLSSAAQNRAFPESCRVGAYVTALSDLAPNKDTFEATLWLWSVCTNDDLQPLETMEFTNAEKVQTLLHTQQQRGDAAWANRKVRGTFRYDWDEHNFPFDRHTLDIQLEEGALDANEFVYEPDTANTTYDPHIDIPGWRISDFTMVPSIVTYGTTFGDPALPPGATSEYSRLTLDVGVVREDLSGFFKLTAVVYAAFILSLITYLMHLESTTALSPQMGLLAGALFAAAVNMLTASAEIGSESGLTLVDKIHIVVLFYILVAALVAVVSRLLVERGWSTSAIARLNYRACAIAVVTFAMINAALIASAIKIG